MSIEAMKLMVAEMEYVLDCINKNKMPFDGDDFHEALRLGRQSIEHQQERCVGCEACIESACGREDCPKGWKESASVAYIRGLEDGMRQAIEQAQTSRSDIKQEPVAWESILGAVSRGWCYEENANKAVDSELAVAIAKEVQALYTSLQVAEPQPQRQWVGLTDDELKDIWLDYDTNMDALKAVEAKLKEKNT